jgi:hypothetical protein
MKRIHEFVFYDKEQNFTYTIIFEINLINGDWLISSLETDDVNTAGEKRDIKGGVKRYLNLIAISLENQGLTARREYLTYLKKQIKERIGRCLKSIN